MGRRKQIEAAGEEPVKATRKRAPKRRVVTRPFFLDGGVEVIVKGPEGAVRLQSTHNTLSIATGDAASVPLPAQNGAIGVSSAAGALAQPEPSWSNCDDRGLNFTRGTADPKAALRDGIPGFLDRVEENVIEQELNSIDEEPLADA